jgi:hypothetical protein
MKAIAGSAIKAREVLTQAAETDEGNPVVCPAKANSKPFAVSLTDAEPGEPLEIVTEGPAVIDFGLPLERGDCLLEGFGIVSNCEESGDHFEVCVHLLKGDER